ncbi:MAG: VTT domain-containing protein [Tepidisphaerales bacterium]
MELLKQLFAMAKGQPEAWQKMIQMVGGMPTLYVVLFLVIFAETGLVVTPFLPGDSLLFALGALGPKVGVDMPLITVMLIAAAVLGDAANYWIGAKLGPAVFKKEDSWLLNKKHLTQAHEFYEKYGGKTIIIARFVPIVRTFAPFVAGIGKMSYATFFVYNIIGAVGWVLICVVSGFFFGKIAFVQKHFELVVVMVVVISMLPMVVEIARSWYRKPPRGFEVIPVANPGQKREPAPQPLQPRRGDIH